MVEATLLNRGSIPPQSLATGATVTRDLHVADKESLTIHAEMAGAAAGDLVVTVTPIQSNGALFGTALTAVAPAGGPAVAAGRVNYYGRYDVRGIDKVQLAIRNNNAGAQQLHRATWNATGDDS